ncbi:hypothetical protein DASC09_005130 [Saccharomycopsis crataegensis]|uniref:Uncharacterized protein n=1 Tax=Saccharomycopsis crataegensis TaxID=43959 RepID=A0AAV5QEK9_9ASCO|nr:hypothetical protein DASC09_005130 [Saccharomycopsis crataegensis]
MSLITKNLTGFVLGATIPIGIVQYWLLPNERLQENQSRMELAHLRTQISAMNWDLKMLDKFSM